MNGPKPIPPIDRFWAKVDTKAPQGCWLWTAYIDQAGYARMGVGSMKDGTRTMAYVHRWSYEHFRSPIPEGLHIDHLCRVRHCVNPMHLEPVTCRENLQRGETFVASNLAKTECAKGHPYDEANTYIHPTTGHRKCRRCRALGMRVANRRSAVA